MSAQISKKHKSVVDASGFFLAKLNELSPAKATPAAMSHLCVQRISCVPHAHKKFLVAVFTSLPLSSKTIQNSSRTPSNSRFVKYVTVCFGLSWD